MRWGRLDLPGGVIFHVVFKAETLAYLSAKILMDYFLQQPRYLLRASQRPFKPILRILWRNHTLSIIYRYMIMRMKEIYCISENHISDNINKIWCGTVVPQDHYTQRRLCLGTIAIESLIWSVGLTRGPLGFQDEGHWLVTDDTMTMLLALILIKKNSEIFTFKYNLWS